MNLLLRMAVNRRSQYNSMSIVTSMIRVMHLPAAGSRLSMLVEATASQYIVSTVVAHKVRHKFFKQNCCAEHLQYCTPVIKEQCSHDNMDAAVSCDSIA